MPAPGKAFFWIFILVTLFGLLVGTLNLLSPDAVHIPFGPNGESAEGLDGILASTLSSAALGVFFGIVAALFALMFRTGVNKAAKPAGSGNQQPEIGNPEDA